MLASFCARRFVPPWAELQRRSRTISFGSAVVSSKSMRLRCGHRGSIARRAARTRRAATTRMATIASSTTGSRCRIVSAHSLEFPRWGGERQGALFSRAWGTKNDLATYRLKSTRFLVACPRGERRLAMVFELPEETCEAGAGGVCVSAQEVDDILSWVLVPGRFVVLTDGAGAYQSLAPRSRVC